MNNSEAILADLTNLAGDVNRIRKYLLVQKSGVFSFVATEHNSKETKKRIEVLREAETGIDKIMGSLLDYTESEFEEAAEALCGRCEKPYDYTRDMNTTLSRDLREQYRNEDKNSTDIAKSALTFFSIVGVFITAARATFGSGSDGIAQVTVIGGIVSGTIVFHKDIKKLFGAAGKAVCNAQIKNRLSGMKIAIKEKGAAKIDDFNNTAKSSYARGLEATSALRKTITKYWNQKKEP